MFRHSLRRCRRAVAANPFVTSEFAHVQEVNFLKQACIVLRSHTAQDLMIARSLSEELGFVVMEEKHAAKHAAKEAAFGLFVKDGTISLRETKKGFGCQSCDFRGLESNLSDTWSSSPLLRAFGLSDRKGNKKAADRVSIFDATPGFGSDMWILAKVRCTLVSLHEMTTHHINEACVTARGAFNAMMVS